MIAPPTAREKLLAELAELQYAYEFDEDTYYTKAGPVMDKLAKLRVETAGTRSINWNEADHPRGPDGKFGATAASNAFDELRNSVDSGIKDTKQLTGGGIALSVQRVTFNNGSVGVVKEDAHPENSDREILVSRVGAVIGAPVPAVLSDDEALKTGTNRVFMEFVPGETLAESGIRFNSPEFLAAENSDAGRRLGLLDMLVGNTDRNPGNLIIQNNGQIVGIDHGNSDFEVHYGNHPSTGAPLPYDLMALEPLARNFIARNGVEWLPGGFSTSDFDEMRPKLQALRDEFELIGRDEWHEMMMDRFEAIAKTAKE